MKSEYTSISAEQAIKTDYQDHIADPPNYIIQVWVDPATMLRNANRSEWHMPEYSNHQTDRYSMCVLVKFSEWLAWERVRTAPTDLPF